MDLKKVKVTASFITDWSLAKRMALKTQGKRMVNEPTDDWKRRMLLSEHSPLRMVQYQVDFENVPQWITVHIARHHVGVEKFIRSQRPDRNENIKVDRDELPQGELNDMSIVINAQALINISKLRLCQKASAETRAVWNLVVEAIRKIDPITATSLVPSCIYRGLCQEHPCCGFAKTPAFAARRAQYEKDMTEPK